MEKNVFVHAIYSKIIYKCIKKRIYGRIEGDENYIRVDYDDDED